jgi:uncharacterized membrane protein YbhN (UPF0104 family)
MKKLARNVISCVLVALLFLLVWQRRHELTPIFKDPSSDLLLLGVLIVIGHFLNSAEFWVVYRATNIRIGFFENWMVFTSGLLGNLLPGQMGTLYKFRYMKQVHQLPYAKSGSNYGANLIISLGSSAIVGIVGVFGNKISSGSFSWVMLLCFIGLGIVCIATLRLSLPTWKFLRGKPAKIFSSFNEGWDEIRRTPRTTFQVIAIDVVKYLVTAWRFQIAFGLLGYHQSFWYFLVIAPAAAIAGIIAFTPGGLGIRELFVTGAALAMGSSFDTGLLAATTDRGAMLASAVVLGSIGFLYSAPRLRRATTTQPTPTDV